MEDKNFYFAVKTERHDDKMYEMCKFDDEENERLSSKAIVDIYGSTDFDLLGFYEKGMFTFRSRLMSHMYRSFKWMELRDITDGNTDYLVFGSSSGLVHHANQYVQAMGYCHVAEGWMTVEGFKRKHNCDYIVLNFITEGG